MRQTVGGHQRDGGADQQHDSVRGLVERVGPPHEAQPDQCERHGEDCPDAGGYREEHPLVERSAIECGDAVRQLVDEVRIPLGGGDGTPELRRQHGAISVQRLLGLIQHRSNLIAIHAGLPCRSHPTIRRRTLIHRQVPARSPRGGQVNLPRT